MSHFSNVYNSVSEKLLEELLLTLAQLIGHIHDISDKEIAYFTVLLKYRHAFALKPLHETRLCNFSKSINLDLMTI